MVAMLESEVRLDSLDLGSRGKLHGQTYDYEHAIGSRSGQTTRVIVVIHSLDKLLEPESDSLFSQGLYVDRVQFRCGNSFGEIIPIDFGSLDPVGDQILPKNVQGAEPYAATVG